jgi:hypothetical protein
LPQDGSVREHKFEEVAAIRSIAKWTDGRPNGHAWDERAWIPAVTRQAARAVHLNRPLLRMMRSFDRQHDPRMRAGPVKRLDRTAQRHLPFGVESRESMVCLDGAARNQSHNAGED